MSFQLDGERREERARYCFGRAVLRERGVPEQLFAADGGNDVELKRIPQSRPFIG